MDGSRGTTTGLSSIVDILERDELIPPQLAEEFRQSGYSNDEIEKVILEREILDPEILAKASSVYFNLPFVHLNKVPLSLEVLKIIPFQYENEFRIVSYEDSQNFLKVAVALPFKLIHEAPTFLVNLQKKIGKDIYVSITPVDEMKEVLAEIGSKKKGSSGIWNRYFGPKEKTKKKVADEEVLKPVYQQLQPEKRPVSAPAQADQFSAQKEISAIQEPKPTGLPELPRDVISQTSAISSDLSQSNFPFIDLRTLTIHNEVLLLIPQEIARKYQLIAFEMAGTSKIKIAAVKPEDDNIQEIISHIEKKNLLAVELFKTTREALAEKITQYQKISETQKQMAEKVIESHTLERKRKEELIAAEEEKRLLEKLRKEDDEKRRIEEQRLMEEQKLAQERQRIEEEKIAVLKRETEGKRKQQEQESAEFKREQELEEQRRIEAEKAMEKVREEERKKRAALEKQYLEERQKFIGLEQAKIEEEQFKKEEVQRKLQEEQVLAYKIGKTLAQKEKEKRSDEQIKEEELAAHEEEEQKKAIQAQETDPLKGLREEAATKLSETNQPSLTDQAETEQMEGVVHQREIEEMKRMEEEAQQTGEIDLTGIAKIQINTPEELGELAKSATVPKIVAGVINFALVKKASDIHIEPTAKNIRIRYRIDGILYDVLKIPRYFRKAIVSRIKILSQLKIDEQRVPQDGRFDVSFKDKSVDIRVSTLPTIFGEKAEMRLLDKSKGILTLEELGLRGHGFDVLIENINKPYGIVIATGPTGAGKSTTLYAILNRISTPAVNVITLEDPVEYEIPGVNQCQIKPQIGFGFAEGLRSVVRQDPNIIMVGEIRDAETAGMATHAALTGHLVLSSLHTNDASGALPRLINMGIEPFLITSAINGILAQRLVRKICPKCKEQLAVPPAVIERVKGELSKLKKVPEKFVFYKGKGCSECHEGYSGRIGIFEVLSMNDKIEDLTVNHGTAKDIRKQAIEDGMITMTQDGILRAMEGATTIEEVFRVTIE